MKKLLLTIFLAGIFFTSYSQVKFSDLKDFIESKGTFKPWEYDITKKFDFCLSVEKQINGATINEIFKTSETVNKTTDNIWFMFQGNGYHLYFPDVNMLFTITSKDGSSSDMVSSHLIWFITQIRGYRKENKWEFEK